MVNTGYFEPCWIVENRERASLVTGELTKDSKMVGEKLLKEMSDIELGKELRDTQAMLAQFKGDYQRMVEHKKSVMKEWQRRRECET